MKSTKVIVAITTFGIVAVSLANAQNATSSLRGHNIMHTLSDSQKIILQQAKTLFDAGKKTEGKAFLEQNGFKPMQIAKGGDRKAIEAAIIAGDFTAFQTIASKSPLKNINQETFNALKEQFTVRKNAEDKIRSILTQAGIPTPEPGKKTGPNTQATVK